MNEVDIIIVLFIVFLILKLSNVIDWSWWWVTAPLWMPAVLLLVLLAFVVIIAIIEGVSM